MILKYTSNQGTDQTFCLSITRLAILTLPGTVKCMTNSRIEPSLAMLVWLVRPPLLSQGTLPCPLETLSSLKCIWSVKCLSSIYQKRGKKAAASAKWMISTRYWRSHFFILRKLGISKPSTRGRQLKGSQAHRAAPIETLARVRVLLFS